MEGPSGPPIMPPRLTLERGRPEKVTAGHERPPDGALAPNIASDELARGLRLVGVCLLALVVFYRPMVSGSVYALAPGAVFGLLLLASALLWLGSELACGRLRVRFGLAGVAFAALAAATLVSALQAENWFAGLQWWWLLVTYGLTAFLILQLGGREPERSFLLSCLLATAAALAAYGLWHYALYMPALRRWLAREPDFFRTAVGATGPISADLAARVEADRATGGFITANQLAGFLVLTFFPLAGMAMNRWRVARLRGTRTRGGRSAALVVVALALALMLGALYLTGSKGGGIAFVFGLALLALTAARQVVRKNPRKAAGAAAAVVILVLVAHQAGAVAGPRRFARSLGVRLDYWRTSVEMARQRPLFGVGPGSWPEWYAMLKEPEFEETRAAHSVHVQLWAETGSVGLLLWIGLWAVLFGQVLSARAASPGRDREANGSVAADRARARRRFRAVGLGLAALVLAFDWAVLGTFGAPRYVPEWLEAHSWLPYLVVYVVWAATFAAIFGGPKRSPVGLPTWAVAAGLGAFLLHSAAEFTLRVPAIGGTAAVLAAALLAGANRPRRREWRVGRLRAGVILLAGAAAVGCWSVVATGRSVDGALSSATADILRNEFLAGDGQLRRGRRLPELRAQADEITAERRRACAAMPWDDRAWRDLGGWLITLAEGGLDGGATAEAARALNRAVELNPLSSSNRALLGRAHALAGDYAGAAAAYRRAAQLHPALPAAWYRLGAALEAAGGADAEALAAYQMALELMPRQYHARNTVLGPQWELATFWAKTAGLRAPQPLLDMATDLAFHAEGVEMPAGAAPKERVARLTEGLPGGAELARKWDSYEPAVRQQEVWKLLAGRMWQWALRRKVQLLQDTGNAGEGGSSGAR